MLIETSKNNIQEMWAINESRGKINCIMEGKNQNFIVFKDQSMEIWGSDRTLLGAQEM